MRAPSSRELPEQRARDDARDHEPAVGQSLDALPNDWLSGYDIARDADVMFHDAQYGDDEYPRHVGWGHSCIEHVMAFARRANVASTVLFHHDPYHTDDELEALLGEAKASLGESDGHVCLAHEGMTVDVDGKGVRYISERASY